MKKDQVKKPPIFTKEQLINSAVFSSHGSVLAGLLKDGERYTTDQCRNAIRDYQKREVR